MRFRIEHRLGVPRSAADVWDVLKDIERWPEWNDLYPQVVGLLRIGARVEVMEQLPGQPARKLIATILDWAPEDQIHWRAASARGWIRRTRYFEIDTLTDAGCIFANGEIWEGFLTRYVGRDQRRRMREGYEAFGDALRARVLGDAGS